MDFSWETLAATLESPQSGTIYALLALLLLSAASLWLQGRAKPGSLARPISYTLAVLMGLRLVEALTFAYAWSGSAPSIQAMAPLERGLHLFTLLALAWVWTQPAEKETDAAPIFAVALLTTLVLALVLFAAWLNAPAGATFNYTDADYAWNAACFVALLLGIVRLGRARQTVGLIAFGILFVGQIAHLLLAEPGGSMPLATQAAHLLVLPLLFLLPVRKADAATITDKQAEGVPNKTADLESEQGLLEDEEAAFFDFDAPAAELLARQMAEEFGADLCVFANLAEQQSELELVWGYNILRDAPIQPTGIPLGDLPSIKDALLSRQPMRLSAKQRLPELWALSKALHLSFQAHLLALPLQVGEQSPWALLLLSLEHVWQAEDEIKLLSSSAELSANLAGILGLDLDDETFLPAAAADSSSAVTDMQTQLGQPEMENEDYRQARSEEIKQAREELRLALEEIAFLHEELRAAPPVAGEQTAPKAQPLPARQTVDLSAVIDDAIALLRPQFQEKRLALRVDLPQHLPELSTDRGALRQILYHLLLNADAATPAEGELTLRAVIDNQKDVGDFVLVQVSDSGGGIPDEDLPRVFSREYHVGTMAVTGVGLSIAETLTLALGGRIWVDSEPGVGSTFNVLLPWA